MCGTLTENRVESQQRREAAPGVFVEATRAAEDEAMTGLRKAFKPRLSVCELHITLHDNVRHLFWLVCRSGALWNRGGMLGRSGKNVAEIRTG